MTLKVSDRRVVLITPEPIGDNMAGPAIRMYELAGAVGAVMPAELVSLTTTSRDQLESLLSTATTVVIQGDVLGLHPWIGDLDVPIVVDAYDPFHLEQLEATKSEGEDRRRSIVRDCISALNVQLSRADFVLCASDRQRALWIGHLSALGRVNPATYDEDPSLDGLIAIVPFGVSGSAGQTPVAGIRARLGVGVDNPIALWAGGVYPWLDAEILVRAMAQLRAELPEARLVVLGGGHPVVVGRPDDARETAKKLAADLGVLEQTCLFPDYWVPYNRRHAWLAEAQVGVSTHLDHVETEFSFRTRCLDYLAAGLPIITSGGDAVSDLVRATGCGIVVAPGDTVGLVDALRIALSDTEFRDRAAAASRAAAKEFQWERVAAPLVEFCRQPRRAPDLSADSVTRALLGVGRMAPVSVTDRIRATLREGGLSLVRRRLVDRVSRLRPGR